MSYTIPIQSAESDFYALIKRGMKEIDASSMLAVKIHLLVTVDHQIFTYDQVIESPSDIIRTTKEAICLISIRADGNFTEKIDFLADIFLKNRSQEFIHHRSHYLRTTTGELSDSFQTKPIPPDQLHQRLNRNDPIPLLDDEQNFILDQSGVKGPLQQRTSWFCSII